MQKIQTIPFVDLLKTAIKRADQEKKYFLRTGKCISCKRRKAEIEMYCKKCSEEIDQILKELASS